MSFKVKKLTVGKGKTVGDEKAGRWERQYYELEADIEDESALELAKGSLESLLDMWLKGETVSQQQSSIPKKSAEIDLSHISCRDATGNKGAFRLANPKDNQGNATFTELQAYLRTHKGKATIQGQFVWLFSDNESVGMKPARRS
jgi:hypothetical protein